MLSNNNKLLKSIETKPGFFNRLWPRTLFKCFILIEIALKKLTLTLFRMVGGGGKKAPYQFFPETSTNVGISPPKTLWVLVSTLLPHCCKISSSYLVPDRNYWTWAKTTPQKSVFSGQILIKLGLWELLS